MELNELRHRSITVFMSSQVFPFGLSRMAWLLWGWLMVSNISNFKMGVYLWLPLNVVSCQKVVVESFAFSCIHEVVVKIGAPRFVLNLYAQGRFEQL